MSEFKAPVGFEDNWRPPTMKRAVEPPPGRRAWSAPDPKTTLARIVGNVPEVVVKITGKTRDHGHVQAHLMYISRRGQETLEDELGVKVAGRAAVKELAERWTRDHESDPGRRANTPISRSIVLGMPAGTDPEKLRRAAQGFAHYVFGSRYEYVLVRHDDANNPHVHLSVRALGHDGRRLNPRKADLQAWRSVFAAELRARGIEAEATPRRARGRARKAEKGVLRRLRDKGVRPERTAQLYRQVMAAVQAGLAKPPSPWEQALAERHSVVRARYLIAAEVLGRSALPEDRKLAEEVRAFVERMPPVATRQRIVEREMRDLIAKGRAIDRGPSSPPERKR